MITNRGVTKAYPNGAYLFLEGDEPSHVVIVRRGRLKLTRTSPNGKQVLIEMRGPGHLLGELGVIDNRVRSAAATAMGPAVVVTVPAEQFRELLRERASISFAVLQSVTGRLRQSVRRRLESGTGDVQARLCSRLLELAEGQQASPDGSIEIDSPPTQQELAEWVGSSRDAVVLVLQSLRRAGLVETGRRRIRVVDPAALQRATVE